MASQRWWRTRRAAPIAISAVVIVLVVVIGVAAATTLFDDAGERDVYASVGGVVPFPSGLPVLARGDECGNGRVALCTHWFVIASADQCRTNPLPALAMHLREHGFHVTTHTLGYTYWSDKAKTRLVGVVPASEALAGTLGHAGALKQAARSEACSLEVSISPYA
jgi:hypothetical protein